MPSRKRGHFFMGFVQGEGRTQGTLFPVCLEELISDDHVCRVIDAFVDRLDMAGLGFERAEAADTGCRRHDRSPVRVAFAATRRSSCGRGANGNQPDRRRLQSENHAEHSRWAQVNGSPANRLKPFPSTVTRLPRRSSSSKRQKAMLRNPEHRFHLPIASCFVTVCEAWPLHGEGWRHHQAKSSERMGKRRMRFFV